MPPPTVCRAGTWNNAKDRVAARTFVRCLNRDGSGHLLGMKRTRLLARVVAACAMLSIGLGSATVVRAADPGRWTFTGSSTMPLYYYQGVTSDPTGDFYFDGVDFGLYRTDSQLNEEARNDDVIPPDVHVREGYNHIGDITWDPGEGGRILLPLECYYPPAGNTCGTGSIGVADPATLRWRYYVKLDPAYIQKAMWAETSPDGSLVWTSSGNDLLAYRTSAIKPTHAAPAGPALKPARILRGAVPPSGITGATFYGDRLFVAGQDGDTFQVWSIDLTTGARQLETERTIVGESEGLDVANALGGVLHWQIQPYNTEGPPTYPPLNGTLLHFVPATG